MEKILFIHDNSHRSRKALEFAISLADKLNSRLLLARTNIQQHAGRVKVLAGNPGVQPATPASHGSAEIEQKTLSEINISAMDARELAQLVNKEGIGMIIKCATEYRMPGGLNLDTLMSHIYCPLLLIPGNWTIKDLQRIVYLADLRYCRNDITRYLTRLARACGAQLSVAHLTKEGMVHIEEGYAHRLFEEQVKSQLKYDQLGFHYTRERDLIRATDVLIKGLQHNLLVMTRNRYHFNQLIGRSINDRLPSPVQVPLLIFPG